MDRMLLVGSEDVLSGGRMAREAGDSMQRAASSIQSSLEQHQRFMTDWLQRFEKAVETFESAVAHMS